MIWVNIFMIYNKDPAAPVPEFIRIGDRQWKTQDLLTPIKTRGLQTPKGTVFQFVLCEPYTKWPATLSKFATPQNVAQRSMRGEMYQYSLILAPSRYYQVSRHIRTQVPFVATKQMYAKIRQSYWQFYFRTQAELQQCLQESPPGQWLAAGHRVPNLIKRQPQDDTNDILSTYRSRGQDRIQRNSRGRTQLDHSVSIQDNGEDGYIIQHHDGRS
jgi:hypothetical protein